MRKVMRYIFIAIVCFSLFGCLGKSARQPAATIGSQSVPENEFRFYFLLSQNAYEQEGGGTEIWLTSIGGAKAEDVAKDRALESVSRVKISCAEASGLGISLNDDDNQKAIDMFLTYKKSVKSSDFSEIGMNDDTLLQIMRETVLYGKVYADVTKNVEVSEKGFADYFAEYLKKDEEKNEEQDETLRDRVRKQYSNALKEEVFNEQFVKWEVKSPIKVNEEIWSGIHILEH